MYTLLAAVSATTTHAPDTSQSAKILVAALAGISVFILGCWIMAKNKRR